MFSIQEQTATLAHLNVRTEKHGDKPHGGADIKLSFTASNGLLAEFHPVLRANLYRAEDTPSNQDDIFVAGTPGSPVESLTVRRFGDLIEGINLKHELKGATVVIGFGLGGASDIDFETVDVSNFHVDLMEGGSCNYSFRVKCSPTGEQIKKLYEVLGGEVTVTVVPPTDKQVPLFGGNEGEE